MNDSKKQARRLTTLAPALQRNVGVRVGGSIMRESLRWEFIIERNEPAGLIARDSEVGTILASGRNASELVENLLTLVKRVVAPLVPWSAVLRTRPDGRVALTSLHRLGTGGACAQRN